MCVAASWVLCCEVFVEWPRPVKLLKDQIAQFMTNDKTRKDLIWQNATRLDRIGQNPRSGWWNWCWNWHTLKTLKSKGHNRVKRAGPLHGKGFINLSIGSGNDDDGKLGASSCWWSSSLSWEILVHVITRSSSCCSNRVWDHAHDLMISSLDSLDLLDKVYTETSNTYWGSITS